MRKTSAFTLVELLIALMIFSVVMVTIYSTFHNGIFGCRNIEEVMEIHQGARQVLERINLDLRNSFAYSATETKFAGAASEMSFLTLIDTFKEDSFRQDYSLVSYRIDENKLIRLCRKGKESLNEKYQEQPREMIANIEALTFHYGYVSSAGQPLEWKERWDDPGVLPAAVKVKLTIKKKIPYDFERTIFLPLDE